MFLRRATEIKEGDKVYLQRNWNSRPQQWRVTAQRNRVVGGVAAVEMVLTSTEELDDKDNLQTFNFTVYPTDQCWVFPE